MELVLYTLRNVAGAIITPPLVFVLITLAVVLYFKNKKIVAMQKLILGGSVNSSVELTLSQLVLGILGGAVGSLILTSLGVVFSSNSGIAFLFIVSIFLMFINQRFICFSYSAAILGVISILIKLGNEFAPGIISNEFLNVDVLYLMIFVGIFHVIEGILVMIDGDRGAVPVFTNRNGRIIGGYALKRYWVLPVAIMIGVLMKNSSMDYLTEYIENPSWWPLVKSSTGLDLIANSVISIFPFYAVLGYSSITFTKSKREKALSSGIHIFIYGIALTVVAQIARFGIWGEAIVVCFAPAAHELMLKFQAKSEIKREPKFVSDEEGLMILEISPNSKVKEFGVTIENKLLSINNININSEAEAYSIIKENLNNTVLKIKDSQGIIKDIKFRHNKNTRLGILLVPRNIEKDTIINIKDNSFKEVFNKIKNNSNNSYKDDELDQDEKK
ncbi:signal protein PDZ [Clostridium sp. C2-6-12]|uniref:signal protein PDZ n=1 Tax=Clostridium sp. C2-6-12 TaxID=2698832 RepID=UPI001367EDD4|nr:signal protein PDZ [Clostridium sp. C2-6-12]